MEDFRARGGEAELRGSLDREWDRPCRTPQTRDEIQASTISTPVRLPSVAIGALNLLPIKLLSRMSATKAEAAGFPLTISGWPEGWPKLPLLVPLIRKSRTAGGFGNRVDNGPAAPGT